MTSTLSPNLARLLEVADRATTDAPVTVTGPLRVGVDLGTAYTVIFVVDESGLPVAGAYRFADVVRDGVVLDYAGAVDLVRRLKSQIEQRIGRGLTTAAVTIPPGVPVSEVRSHGYVVEAAGLECTAIVDEPTAANAVLQVADGAVVDVGGGTTGIAVLRDGEVVATADDPTGGTHLTLVVAGAHGISFEEAELLKRDQRNHARLFPVVRPVLEKIGTLVADRIRGYDVEQIYLVGGTSAFTGIADVVASVTGVPAVVPGAPLFVTPVGVALHDTGGDAG
ncbi:ethanolamine utilization protein EutJ [Nocardioides humi]|uniref:Ethanolamine utilization protein EutJ n=1 Tax=Nocardioides humi TaxID=449461 RepID=A0ABN2BJE1_9ACTN|nr:ethanolamine utilization protein EutJ [Nocardioides humi]